MKIVTIVTVYQKLNVLLTHYLQFLQKKRNKGGMINSNILNVKLQIQCSKNKTQIKASC